MMYLPSYVKSLPKWTKKLPYFSVVRGIVLGKTIYLENEIYTNLNSNNPTFENKSILVHEQVHYKRINDMGILKFNIQYIFIPQKRFLEELLAIKEQMKFLKENNQNYSVERTARALSSWAYLWCTSYSNAHSKLQQEWNGIDNV